MDSLGPRIGSGTKMEILANPNGSKNRLPGDSEAGPENRTFKDLLPEKKSEPKTGEKSPALTRTDKERRSGQVESKEPQKVSRPQVKAEKKAKKGTGNEQAMQKFMDSMESEFGITPERMLEAMAKLDPEELSRSPEETAPELIGNLKLDKEDEAGALAAYMVFLQQWQPPQSDRPELRDKDLAVAMFGPLAVPQATMPAQGSEGKAAISAGERRLQLNRSLDQLNDRFFRTNMTAEGQPSELMAVDPENDETNLVPTRDLSEPSLQARERKTMAALGLGTVSAGLGQDVSGAAREVWIDPNLAGQATGDDPSVVAATAGEDGPVAGEDPRSTGELEKLLQRLHVSASALGESSAKPMTVAMASAKPLDVSALQVPGLGWVAHQAVQSDDSHGDLGSDSDGSNSENGSSGLERQLHGGDFAQALLNPQGKSLTNAGSAVGGAALFETTSNAQSPMDAIKEQAQFIVQKGGGEAKIRLNQEGMGDVLLKVNVRDGRVNIDIATDNHDTKKLIESSIADLKSSLASHKLSVDSVKVDVGQGDLGQSQQRNMEFNQDQARQQARQFLSQFRDEMAGRRDPFVEMAGIKAYGRKRAEPDRMEASGPATAPRRVSGRGENMNLVA